MKVPSVLHNGSCPYHYYIIGFGSVGLTGIIMLQNEITQSKIFCL